MIIDIQPVTVPTKGTGNQFTIQVVSYGLGSNEATFYWNVGYIVDNFYYQILEGNLTMKSPEFDQWGTDDEYVVNWALNQLNFTKA